MVARYGDRTRVSQQVSSWGKDVEGGADLPEEFVETFTAPGTWNWPGKVDSVTVTVVGGGGGSGRISFSPSLAATCGGGGGGVRLETVPVSGPAPVVVGAGGAAGTPTPGATNGGIGGDSSFGPIVVGGGAGGNANSSPFAGSPGVDAPPIGGGGSGGNSPGTSAGKGGLYGYPSLGLLAGGAGSQPRTLFPGLQVGHAWKGFGSAGRSRADVDPTSQGGAFNAAVRNGDGFDTPVGATKPNSGNGAPNQLNPPAITTGTASGYAGSSGVVIVRYWQ